MKISNRSALAPDEENNLRKVSGRSSGGNVKVEKGNELLTVVKKLQKRSRAPELRKIPTATSSPINEGAISKTVRRPCLAPFKKSSNTCFLINRA
ncbi:MAG: hypothetical protein K6G76_10965 [Lachnospiraceae bacterium]|nr:hypothetical protein [Lachnospiraceae bacterium]